MVARTSYQVCHQNDMTSTHRPFIMYFSDCSRFFYCSTQSLDNARIYQGCGYHLSFSSESDQTRFFSHGGLSAKTSPESFCFFTQLPARFGLEDASANRWTNFKFKISELNRKAESGTKYKVFFFGRHGEGYRTYLCFCCIICSIILHCKTTSLKPNMVTG
jgi:hypothetical protein